MARFSNFPEGEKTVGSARRMTSDSFVLMEAEEPKWKYVSLPLRAKVGGQVLVILISMRVSRDPVQRYILN